MAEDREGRVGLASAVAHELRTPLAAVRGAARALAEGPTDEVTRRRLVTIVLDAAAQAERLVDDLLDVGAVEAGALSVVSEAVDVRAVVAAAAEAARATATGVSVVERLPDRGLRATGDPGRVRQVVANLLANAVAHAPPGSEVEIEAGLDGGRVRVAVTDQGPGVPPADRERIFEPYVSLGDRRGAAGLGLYLSRELARAMGGELGYEPTPGFGARFVLALPTA